MLGTAAVESGLGFLLHLHHKGHHGIGIYQIQPDDHHALWDEWLAFQPDLASLVRGLASQHDFLKQPDAELATNLRYATAIAWLLYERRGLKLPRHADLAELASAWLNYYPSVRHVRTAHSFCEAWLQEKNLAA